MSDFEQDKELLHAAASYLRAASLAFSGEAKRLEGGEGNPSIDKNKSLAKDFALEAVELSNAADSIKKDAEEQVVKAAQQKAQDVAGQIRNVLSTLPAGHSARASLEDALKSVDGVAINTASQAEQITSAIRNAESAANNAEAAQIQEVVGNMVGAAAGIATGAAALSGGIGGLVASGAALFPAALSGIMSEDHEKLNAMLGDNPAIRSIIEKAKGFVPEMLSATNVRESALFTGATAALITPSAGITRQQQASLL